MFYFLGVGLAFFLNLLLLSKRRKSLGDKVLACWLFIMMLHLAMFAFFQLKWYPQLWGTDLPLPLFHGPFLYLYTIALTRDYIPLRDWILNLIIPIAFYIYLIPFFLLPTEQKIFVYDNEGIGYEPFLALRAICIPLSGVLYVTLSSMALFRHRRSITQEFSSLEKINLLWLQYLIIWIGAIWVLVIIGNDDLIFGATVLFIFFIGYFGIKQGGIFHSYAGAPETIDEKELVINEESNASRLENVQKPKYQKSGLTSDISDALHQQLISLMSTHKPYCESELSLSDLATRLNTQPNYLSQIINEREGKNFYDYINTLRVQEFTLKVNRPESRKLTLFAIAQQCGFNSKSSFNRYFKKVTGQSPSEYTQGILEADK